MAAAAGISAAGSIIGGITGGKGAKKAAKIQQQTAQMQIAANNANLDKITGLEQPTIDRGNSAGTLEGNFLGLGADPGSAKVALDTFRGSTGYQDLLNTGLNAVNSNAYASGMGDSGATLKALQAKGSAIADQSGQQYLSNLDGLNRLGTTAIGNIAGVNTSTTAANNNASQGAADASSNAALASSAAWQKALSNLTSIGQGAAGGFGSSYGSGSGYGAVSGIVAPTGSYWGGK